jgi:hypothetical protein
VPPISTGYALQNAEDPQSKAAYLEAKGPVESVVQASAWACRITYGVGSPQLARGNKYRTVIPAPLARSIIKISPSFISASMASQQEADALPVESERHNSPQLIRRSIRPYAAARPN